jgi:hypothetical protein
MRSAIVLGVVLCMAAAARGQGQATADPATAPGAPTKVHASMIQLMRGLFLPQSNVIFTAQTQDPATIPPDEPAATSPNPLRLRCWLSR